MIHIAHPYWHCSLTNFYCSFLGYIEFKCLMEHLSLGYLLRNVSVFAFWLIWGSISPHFTLTCVCQNMASIEGCCSRFLKFTHLPISIEIICSDSARYCPTCKNDTSEVVKAGEKLKASKKKAKMPSATTESQRDWGKVSQGVHAHIRWTDCTVRLKVIINSKPELRPVVLPHFAQKKQKFCEWIQRAICVKYFLATPTFPDCFPKFCHQWNAKIIEKCISLLCCEHVRIKWPPDVKEKAFLFFTNQLYTVTVHFLKHITSQPDYWEYFIII